ncbi:MAG TPA: hypothetical protein VLM37_09110, partial [Fibrobacteraceae bacterium]|nr:hypothetical protein [Fibrobacteraceae bacterium]
MNPLIPQAHNLHAQGKSREALEQLLVYARMHPEEPDAYAAMAEILYDMGSKAKAQELMQGLWTQFPKRKFQFASSYARIMEQPLVRPKVALYALRELHVPVLLPVYEELSQNASLEVGIIAPAFNIGNIQMPEEGLRAETLEMLEQKGIPFWGT